MAVNYVLDKDFYSTFDIAKLLQMSDETIRRYIAAGFLPAIKLMPGKNGRYRISKEQLAEYLKARGATVEIK